MMPRKGKIGSDFDEFLEDEGILAGAEAVAAKRVFVFQLEKELRRQKVNRAELADRMGEPIGCKPAA